VAVALNLVPFAGIAFLWFIGVIRDRIGEREDRFFGWAAGDRTVAMITGWARPDKKLLGLADAPAAPALLKQRGPRRAADSARALSAICPCTAVDSRTPVDTTGPHRAKSTSLTRPGWLGTRTGTDTVRVSVTARRDSHQSRGNFASWPEPTIILVYDSAALV
jgi:hypothetical protein